MMQLTVRTPRPYIRVLPAALAAVLLVSGCAHHKKDKGLTADLAASKVTQIGVNAYLWRAALDTVSFMPLTQVDSNGGVIVTDWYINPQTPTERMKLTVTILDQDLRADAVRVAASRQIGQAGQWADAPVAAQTVQRLEEIILERARDLRRGAVSG
jgi:ABC-type phosphate/phosphonate transport system permease subunit